MADRSRSGGGGTFDPNQPYKTFYFVLLLAIVFTVKDIYLSDNNAAGGRGGKMSSESGSESEGDGGDTLRQRKFEEPRPESSAGFKLAAGSKLSAGKLGGPVMKFMYW